MSLAKGVSPGLQEPVPTILAGLEGFPILLADLVRRIPAERRRRRPVHGAWSIHEHVAHLAEAQERSNERAQAFIDHEHPRFEPREPDAGDDARRRETELDDARRRETELDDALERIAAGHELFVHLLGTLLPEDWSRKASHPGHASYTPLVMARHALLHDYHHLYRIEELARTPPAGD